MDHLQAANNQIPGWAQWLGIWSSFLGFILAPWLIPIGRLVSRKAPKTGFFLRIFSFIALTIIAILCLLRAFVFDVSSRSVASFAIVGTLCSIAGVLCLLSLFPRILPQLLLFFAKHFGPLGMCKTHRDKIRQTFDSFELLIQRNSHSAWLLPPPSFDVVSDDEHGLDYLELEFREWSWLVTGSKGRNGLIEDTKYLFITWHWIQPPNYYDRNLVEKLGPMLTKVGQYTLNDRLTAHRILVGPWLTMDTSQWAIFKDIIWRPYFEPYCGSSKINYRIRFIDRQEILREFNSHKDRSSLEYFLDVAFFSFDSNMRSIVQGHAEAILPFPEDYPHKKELQEYAALQYSERFDGFLALQAVQGTSAKRRGTKYGNRAIRDRRLAVRNVWDRAKTLRSINDYVKTTAGIDFCNI